MLDKILQENKFYCNDGIFYPISGKVINNISYDDDAHDFLNDVEDNSWWFRHRNRCIETIVCKYSENSVFVEVGAGNGYIARNIAHKMNVAIFEPGIIGARNCVKRGLINVVCGLFGDDTVVSESIDNIGIFDVLEHIEDELSFLMQLSNALSVKGKLFITVPAHMSLWTYADEDAHHFRRYELTQLKNVVTRAGFEVEYASYIFSLLNPLIWIFRCHGKSKQSKTERNLAEFLPPTFIGKIAEIIFSPEITLLQQGITIPFGASILLVAKKRGL